MPDRPVPPAQAANDFRTLDPHQFQRCAQMIADGELPLAVELDPLQQQQLSERIRVLRRQRLMDFFARHIAASIDDDRRKESNKHA